MSCTLVYLHTCTSYYILWLSVCEVKELIGLDIILPLKFYNCLLSGLHANAVADRDQALLVFLKSHTALSLFYLRSPSRTPRPQEQWLLVGEVKNIVACVGMDLWERHERMDH